MSSRAALSTPVFSTPAFYAPPRPGPLLNLGISQWYALLIHLYHISKPAESAFTKYGIHNAFGSSDSKSINQSSWPVRMSPRTKTLWVLLTALWSIANCISSIYLSAKLAVECLCACHLAMDWLIERCHVQDSAWYSVRPARLNSLQLPMTNSHSNNWPVNGRAIIIQRPGAHRFVLSASGTTHILVSAY